MGINKVDYFGETLIDLTEDTVTADALKKGITAHAKNGEQIVGENETKLQSKSATPTKSAQTIKPDSGYDGLSQVQVGAIPSDYIIPSGTLAITSNGTKDVKNYASVNVNVPNTFISGRERQTPSSNVRTLTFNLPLNGKTPTVVFVCAETAFSGNGTSTLDYLIEHESEGFVLSKYITNSSLSNTGSANCTVEKFANGAKITVKNSYFRSGIQYYCRGWA